MSVRAGSSSHFFRPTLSYLFEDKNLKMHLSKKPNAIVPYNNVKLFQRRSHVISTMKILHRAASRKVVETNKVKVLHIPDHITSSAPAFRTQH